MRVGQGGATTGQVTNLMSNDCQRIMQASGLFQNFWFQPVLCVVCMVLLFVYVGISGIVGSICMDLFVRRDEERREALPCVYACMLVCCMLYAVCCMLYAVCCMLYAVLCGVRYDACIV